MEPCFNFAIEEQAIGRVYRMGQKREVSIVRFVTKGTIEENMMAHRAEVTKRGTARAAPVDVDSPGDTEGGATKDAGSGSGSASATASASSPAASSSAGSTAQPLGVFQNEAAGAITADGGKSASYDFNKLFGVDDPPEPEPANEDSDDDVPGPPRLTLGEGTNYYFDTARSRASKCKGCYEHIETGAIRLCTKGGSWGGANYYHVRCSAKQINKKFGRAGSGGPAFPLAVVASCLKQFGGSSGLNDADKKVLQAAKAARQSEAPGKNKRKHGR